MSEACIFCDIVARKSEAEIVYEDDQILGFLDLLPMSRGHVLVIPKEHHDRIDKMPSDIAGHLGAQLPFLSKAILSAVNAEDFNIVTNAGASAGQVVNHVHFHIVPKAEPRAGRFAFINRYELEDDEKRETGEKIRKAISDTKKGKL